MKNCEKVRRPESNASTGLNLVYNREKSEMNGFLRDGRFFINLKEIKSSRSKSEHRTATTIDLVTYNCRPVQREQYLDWRTIGVFKLHDTYISLADFQHQGG